MPKIIIHLYGGLVESVYRQADNSRKTRVFVMIRDSDECFDEHVTKITDSEGDETVAYIYESKIEKLPKSSIEEALIEKYLADRE